MLHILVNNVIIAQILCFGRKKVLFRDQLSVTSYQLPVISYQLPVISYQLSVTSYQLPVISYQLSVAHVQIPYSISAKNAFLPQADVAMLRLYKSSKLDD